ncbi:MAG TPA: hypothetical protein VHK69_11840 [Chitinophagaceae bacterium]|jgi:hypothetical protein|nr:hypothetical protein [Chitinophagaceae bacterium]
MKRILLIIVLIAAAAGGWYAYRAFNRTNPDLAGAEPVAQSEALALIAAFEKDSAAFNRQYVDKVVSVTGTVKKIDAEGNPVVLFLGDAAEMSSVQCSMDSSHAAQYTSIQSGATVTLKGMVTGAVTEELFGTDVKLNRCVPVKTN